jgi:5-methylcytosine-specific restriction protein A
MEAKLSPSHPPLRGVYLDASVASPFLCSRLFQSEKMVRAVDVKVFDGEEKPYMGWIQAHPDGLVLNTERTTSADYARFHQPQCPHISERGSEHRPDGYTQYDRIKVCAEESEALIEWLLENRPLAVAGARPCKSCKPEVGEVGLYQHPEEEAEPETHEEGSTATVEVNRYERSEAARRACLKYHGAECQVCGLRFEERYGEIGKGFIEVHHEVPLSETEGAGEVDPIEDLKPVCPNCHAMLHQESPPLTIEELKGRFTD